MIVFGSFSPLGAYAVAPKSMTNAIRLVSLSAFTPAQILLKSGFTRGASEGMSSELNTNDQPSTDPSAISTVGPVMAAVHIVLLGAAWKYPQ